MIPKPLAVVIVCLVTVVWLGNFAAQFLVPGYQVDGWIHSIFLTVVGGALAISRKGGQGPPNDPPAAPAGPDAPPAPPPPDPPSGPRHAALVLLPSWRHAT